MANLRIGSKAPLVSGELVARFRAGAGTAINVVELWLESERGTFVLAMPEHVWNSIVKDIHNVSGNHAA